MAKGHGVQERALEAELAHVCVCVCVCARAHMCARAYLSLRDKENQAGALPPGSRANSPTPKPKSSCEEGASSESQLPSPDSFGPSRL